METAEVSSGTPQSFGHDARAPHPRRRASPRLRLDRITHTTPATAVDNLCPRERAAPITPVDKLVTSAGTRSAGDARFRGTPLPARSASGGRASAGRAGSARTRLVAAAPISSNSAAVQVERRAVPARLAVRARAECRSRPGRPRRTVGDLRPERIGQQPRLDARGQLPPPGGDGRRPAPGLPDGGVASAAAVVARHEVRDADPLAVLPWTALHWGLAQRLQVCWRRPRPFVHLPRVCGWRPHATFVTPRSTVSLRERAGNARARGAGLAWHERRSAAVY